MADALTIKFAGRKAKGESHYDIIALLKDYIPENIMNNNALNNFKKLIDHKNIVSHSGDMYYKKDIDKQMKNYERFAHWSFNLLEE